ncbi:uncharacterized protein Dvir_GJ27112 [Drosophila virilis]|uniref:Uncharacterized protein n=1 Tax=Drosophila virilis TaxID=7244 RepID=A0A0Q9WFP6_DROVI|nr:uncharacterized protein Dvir_GJ27112 [Drosophila virilis]
MNAYIFPTALLFCSVVFTESAKTKIVAIFHKVLCENQEPKMIAIFNCHVNLTTSNVSGLYVEFKLAQDVTNVNGLYILAIEHGNKFINYTAQEMNYCEALHVIHGQYLTQMVAVGLRRVSNFPLDCPFKKHQLGSLTTLGQVDRK